MDFLKQLASTNCDSFQLTEDHIQSVLAVRRARSAILGGNLFSDPAWDILLELYAAKLGHRRMSLTELALSIEIPVSTTGRWLSALVSHGLVQSTPDNDHAGNDFLRLTDDGATRMERLAGHWASAFTSI